MTRSGSTHLCELLDQHPMVRCLQEPLTAGDADTAHNQYSDHISDAELIEAAFRTDEPVAAIGCKLLAEQLRNRPHTMRRLRQVPDIRFVVLERANQLEGARSMAQARTTGVWTTNPDDAPPPMVRLDPHACLDRLELADTCYAAWRRLPAAIHTWVDYDALRDGQDEALAPVWRLLGVDPPGPLASSQIRREHRPLSQTVENYTELQHLFAGTRYAHHLGV